MASRFPKKTASLTDKLRVPGLRSPREIWLAGLGALAMAQKESVKMAEEGTRLFEKLVKEGGKFEKKWTKAARDEAVELTDELATATKKALRGNEPVAYHLVPKGDAWTIRLEGHDDEISTHANKNAAMTAARGLAQAHEPSRLVIHRADGTIQASHSYGEAA